MCAKARDSGPGPFLFCDHCLGSVFKLIQVRTMPIITDNRFLLFYFMLVLLDIMFGIHYYLDQEVERFENALPRENRLAIAFCDGRHLWPVFCSCCDGLAAAEALA